MELPNFPPRQDAPPAEFREEPLISLAAYFGDRLMLAPQYYLQGIPGAVNDCLLRRGAAERLEKALAGLPVGLTFKIYDAWRPVAVQRALFDTYYARLQAEHPEWDGAILTERTRKFVSLPSTDPEAPSVHNSGGAIDLTLARLSDGSELDMGTAFDDFTDRAHTAYFEKLNILSVKNNRRLLYRVMTEAGFTNYPLEWWHFDYGDRFWSESTGRPAIYRGVL